MTIDRQDHGPTDDEAHSTMVVAVGLQGSLSRPNAPSPASAVWAAATVPDPAPEVTGGGADGAAGRSGSGWARVWSRGARRSEEGT